MDGRGRSWLIDYHSGSDLEYSVDGTCSTTYLSCVLYESTYAGFMTLSQGRESGALVLTLIV